MSPIQQVVLDSKGYKKNETKRNETKRNETKEKEARESWIIKKHADTFNTQWVFQLIQPIRPMYKCFTGFLAHTGRIA